MMAPSCPLCTAQPSMVEKLKKSLYFCDSCGRVFKLDPGGLVIHQEPTNKSRTRKTDVNGYPLDGGD